MSHFTKLFVIYIYINIVCNKAPRSYIHVCIFVYILPIVGQTAGPNLLNFFCGNQWVSGGNKGNKWVSGVTKETNGYLGGNKG